MDYDNINWKTDKQKFIDYLTSFSEEQLRDFSKQITPGDFLVLGIRMPVLHTIANNISKTNNFKKFLELPEENILEFKIIKGYVISNIKDMDEFKTYFHKFIPEIDNWAVCDTFLASAKIIKKDREYFYELTTKLIKSTREFENRIAFVILLDYFIDDEYRDKIFALIKNFKSSGYYANMGLAWLVSGLFITYPEETKDFLKTKPFEPIVMRYISRKVRDSYRVSKENKEWIKNILT